jgi:class 3 adenylate cyclase/tetratricopeptide (TPR) repeat protein
MTQELPEGTVTIVFTDVVGSTDLTMALGDTAAQEVLRVHRELVRQQIKSSGGYEVKGTGDGFMVAFQSARRAVECAIGVQRSISDHNQRQPAGQRALIRIGMNAGEVIREDADMFGSAVNAAARVAAKAGGDQILVSETVKSLLGAAKDLQFTDRGRFRLKGFPERWRLFEVVWQDEASANSRPALTERTPFVGREGEKQELRRYAKTAVDGQGTMVLIGGEAGVGKSRLVEEIASEARSLGMLALLGRCYEMTGAPPYIPFVEMLESAGRLTSPEALRAALGDSAPEVAKLVPELRRMLPDIQLPPELPPEQERRYAFNGVRDFLTRAGRVQPLLLIIEDLHWADDSSIVLLLHIAQQLSDMPVLILATYRDLEVSPGSPLSRAFEELTRQRLARSLAVKRLPEPAVAAMLRTLGGREPPKTLTDVIFAETEGNPFFVEEVLKHLAEEGRLFDDNGQWRSELSVGEADVPETLRLVIGRRLDRLGENVRRVLTGAAVIGRSFSFELLTALSELDADALLDAIDEAERAQLLISMSDGAQVTFRFSHELIRQTLLSSVSAARRQRLHLRAAEEIEQAHTFARQEHAPDVAYHLAEAGATADPVKTAHYLTLAGDRALSSAAYEDALRNYEDALSSQPGGERRTHADLLYKRGFALRSLGRWEEALAGWRQAVAAYQSVGDIEAIGRIYGAITQQLLWAGRFEEALDLSLRGLRRIGRRPSPDRCLLLVGGGLTLSLVGFHEAGDRMMSQAVDLAEELGDSHLLGRVLVYKAFHHLCYAELAEELVAATKACALLRAAGDMWELANALALRTFALLGSGQIDEVDQAGLELHPLATRVGHYGALLFCERILDQREFMRDPDFARREAYAIRDRELCLEAGIPVQSQSYSYLALVRLWQGRWDESLSCCQQAIADEAPGVFLGIDWSTLFRVRSAAGQKAAALGMLQEKYSMMPGRMTPARRVSTMLLLLRAAGSSGLNVRIVWNMARQTGSSPFAKRALRRGQVKTIGVYLAGLGLVEGLGELREGKEAGKYYLVVAEGLNSTGAVLGYLGARLTEPIAGIAAAGAGLWQEAEAHFQKAMRQADELPHKLEQPEVRRWYARMLLDRDAVGDRDEARRFLQEAIAMYREIGMPKHVEMAEALLKEAGRVAGPGVHPTKQT